MTFDDVITLKSENDNLTDLNVVKNEIETFITQVDFEQLDDRPRIIIVSKEFRPEVTSTVLWLRKFGVEIDCVKLSPYILDENKIGIVSQKIIPLPEAEDYLIQVQRKEDTTKTLTRSQQEYLTFYTDLIEMLRTKIPLTLAPPKPQSYYKIQTGIGGIHYEWGFHGRGRSSFGVELHFESSKKLNYERIMKLEALREVFSEQIGEELVFQKEWGKYWSRIFLEYPSGRMTEELKEWAIDRMFKFYNTFQPILENEII
jgi:hypothetical protein